MAGWHERVQAIEKQRGGFRDQAHEMETLLATLDVQRNNLEERIEEQYKGAFAALLDSVQPEDVPRELEMDEGVFQIEQAAELLEAKRQKISSLGPINHLALEEYETKKERLEFLEHQRDDVEKARDDLTNAITEINRTARKRFVQTFEEVRRNYIAVFQTLFKGGRADLQLIRTEDPLESNLQVMAQPTGKVIDNVSLLSGGERCLTALSLLFAVYLVKPSPFCMLDEADAPLDDVNIGRFVNMLREFSNNTQFLVITHNKLTMETANHLYGVTMMEPGISNIVSVSFHDVAETQSDQELSKAIADRRREIDRKRDERRTPWRRRSDQGRVAEISEGIAEDPGGSGGRPAVHIRPARQAGRGHPGPDRGIADQRRHGGPVGGRHHPQHREAGSRRRAARPPWTRFSEVIRGDVVQILTTATPKVRPISWEENRHPARRAKKQEGQEGQEGQTTDAAVPLSPNPRRRPRSGLRVIFVVGVNGTGKTTSIAKLAHLLKSEGQQVLLAAGDTFRAAAVEQLEIWAERIGVDCISQGTGADPAAVVFDALSAGEARGCRRGHRRYRRSPAHQEQPDGRTGQGGPRHPQEDRTRSRDPAGGRRQHRPERPGPGQDLRRDDSRAGMILTKLDGTAKGGIVVAIAETLGLPVRYVGMGEQVGRPGRLRPEAFAEALFAGWSQDGDQPEE